MKDLTGFVGLVSTVSYQPCRTEYQPTVVRVVDGAGDALQVEEESGQRFTVAREHFDPRYIRIT